MTFYKTTNFKSTCSTWSFLKIATIFEQSILFAIVVIVVYFYRLLKVRWMPRSSGLTTWMVTSWRIFAERGWPPWGNEPSRRMSGSVMLVTHCCEIRSKTGLQLWNLVWHLLIALFVFYMPLTHWVLGVANSSSSSSQFLPKVSYSCSSNDWKFCLCQSLLGHYIFHAIFTF